MLGVELGEALRMVGYETDNRMTNTGSNVWKPETGLLSIWMLGMYNPSPEPGKPPLGPFYELETSSPAAAFKPGETLRHVQRTFHIQGSQEQLGPLARRLLGTKLDVIKETFIGEKK